MKYKCPKCEVEYAKPGKCTIVKDPLLWGTIMSDGYTDAGVCSTPLEEVDGIRRERTTRD